MTTGPVSAEQVAQRHRIQTDHAVDVGAARLRKQFRRDLSDRREVGRHRDVLPGTRRVEPAVAREVLRRTVEVLVGRAGVVELRPAPERLEVQRAVAGDEDAIVGDETAGPAQLRRRHEQDEISPRPVSAEYLRSERDRLSRRLGAVVGLRDGTREPRDGVGQRARPTTCSVPGSTRCWPVPYLSRGAETPAGRSAARRGRPGRCADAADSGRRLGRPLRRAAGCGRRSPRPDRWCAPAERAPAPGAPARSTRRRPRARRCGSSPRPERNRPPRAAGRPPSRRRPRRERCARRRRGESAFVPRRFRRSRHRRATTPSAASTARTTMRRPVP